MVATNNSMLVRSHTRSPNSVEDRQPRLSKRISHAEPDHGGLPHIADRPTRRHKSYHHKKHSTTQHQPTPVAPTQNQAQLPNQEPINTTMEWPNQAANAQTLNDEPNQTNPIEANPPIPTSAPNTQVNTTTHPWDIPRSEFARMDPAVLTAYQRLANNHHDADAAQALFDATIRREAEVYRQLEDLRHKNEILKRDQLAQRQEDMLRHEKRARKINRHEERAQRRKFAT